MDEELQEYESEDEAEINLPQPNKSRRFYAPPDESIVDCVEDVSKLINYTKKIINVNLNPRKHKLDSILKDEFHQQKEMKLSEIKNEEGSILPPLPNEVIKLTLSNLGRTNYPSVFRYTIHR